MNIRKSYKTLELDYGASLSEVKKGYRDMVRVWHPDRFNQEPGLKQKAEEKLKEVNMAYSVLMRFFLPDSGCVSGPGCQPFRWWHRAFWGMGLIATLIRRHLYQRALSRVRRIELGWVARILLNGSSRMGTVGDEKTRTDDSFQNRGTAGNAASGLHEHADFKSVFDEVAREKGERRGL